MGLHRIRAPTLVREARALPEIRAIVEADVWDERAEDWHDTPEESLT